MKYLIELIVAFPFIGIGWVFGIIKFGFYFGYEAAELGGLRKETLAHYKEILSKIIKEKK